MGQVAPSGDVYSLGVVYYRLLAHRLPFRSTDLEELEREIIEDDPQPPRQLALDIPAAVERVCLNMLAKDPAARPADAVAVVRELRDALAAADPVGLTAPPLRGQPRADPARRTTVLAFTWDTPDPAVGAALTGDLGPILCDAGSTWVLRSSAEPAEFLGRTLSALRHLVRLPRPGRFLLEVAEDEALTRRAVWLRGRVTHRGVSLPPKSVATLCRWMGGAEPAGEANGWRVRFGGETHPLSLDAEADDTDRPLVGRSAPLAFLQARWDQACERLGQTVVLTGEAGAGKTRLVRELRRHATPRARWVEWSCLPGRDRRLGHPAVNYFADPRNRGTADGRFPVEGLTAVSPRDRWHRSLTDWLRAQSAVAPTAFVVEDVQWADPETLSFLHALVELGVRDRLLVVFTARPEFESPWGSRADQTLVSLGRLTRRHAADLYRSVTGVAPPPEALDGVMAATGGVPQFVEGLAEAVVRGRPDRPTLPP